MDIPTLHPPTIDPIALEKLMRIGFCYVQLSDPMIIQYLKECMDIARQFFQKSPEEKALWQLKNIIPEGERYQGYTLRNQSKNTNAVEQIFFEPDAPFGPYEIHAEKIYKISHYYMNSIFYPIIGAIFKKLNLTEDALQSVIREPNRSLVFQQCPKIGEQKNAVRLNAHKDFGYLTMVYFEEPGLEVQYEKNWHSIPPQENCVVINLGNAMELMTLGKCRSALHRVINATDNRISTVYFSNPNYRHPVRDLINNSVIAASGEEFFKQQFFQYYEVEY